MIKHFLLVIFSIQIVTGLEDKPGGYVFDYIGDLGCPPGLEFNTTLKSYYVNDKFGYRDKNGRHLQSLQGFLDGRSQFVTVSVDENLKIPYGKKVCIESLNQHYGRWINFEIRDSSSNLKGHGFNRIDVYVWSKADSYDKSVNKYTKIVIYEL